MRLRTAAAALTLSLALTVSGCAQAHAPDTISHSAHTTNPVSPSTSVAVPQPSATEHAPDPASALTCDGLLNAESLAEFDAGSFGLPAQEEIDSYVDKTRAEGSPLALFDGYGGLLCPVTNGTRVSELYGYSPITVDQAAKQRARLAAEGFSVSSHNGGDLYSTAADHDDVVYQYLFTPESWYCAIDLDRLDEVVANSRPA